MASEQQYIELFAQTESTICKHSAEVINLPRRDAIEHFKHSGFPSTKTEEYRYTDIDALFAPDYGMNLNRLHIPAHPQDAFKCEVPNMSTLLYFIVNDQFYESSFPHSSLPEGVIIDSLRSAALSHPELVKRYYAKLGITEKDSITALNTAYVQDGLFVYLPKGVKLEKTLQIVNLNRANVDFMSHRRMLIVLEENTELRMLVCDHSMDDVRFLTTQVNEVYIGKNASFDLYELEETHNQTTRLSNLYVQQEAHSRALLNGMTLHNGITRNQTRVIFNGESAETKMVGMAISDQKQHVDNLTHIDHAVPNCTSYELYKYVLDGEATGAFNGKVLVRPHAQHTNSLQSNKNLCMTRTAHMYTQPQLEIYADDVKCGHGSTVGQLDENALFYMQSRGISAKEARLMLMFAFVGDVIDYIQIDALRDRLHHLVEKRFRGEFNKCQGCQMCK